jgi:hypothetical protein
MTSSEQDFLIENLNKNQKVLEWGCGSSTIEISKHVKEIYSIEHNVNWHNKINREVSDNTVLFLCEPDLPYHEGNHCGTFDEFKTYITKPKEFGLFDLILIDGRARIECSKICSIISKEDAKIFVHDYRGRYESENYKDIENHLDFVSEVDNLALFKPKVLSY